jgi:hypothetical protein
LAALAQKQGIPMTSLTKNRLTVAAALAVPFAAAAWWLFIAAAPAVASTYAFLALLVIAVALVGINTWYNGQPTGSMAQVIYEADRTPETTPATMSVSRPADLTTASRWEAWRGRGEALTYTGRVRALLAFSIAATGALLLYAWVM